MSVASRTVTPRDYQNAVDGQVQAGFSFGQVEDFINACAIEEDEKTALWLRAWRQQPGDVRRTFADAEVLDHAQAWLLRERVEHRRTCPLAVVPVARDLASCTLASDSSSAGPCGPKVSGLDQTYPEAISCRKDASRNFT